MFKTPLFVILFTALTMVLGVSCDDDDNPTDRLTIESVSPEDDSTDVLLGAQLTVRFSDPVDNPQGGSVTITPDPGDLELTWDNNMTLQIQPTALLLPDTTYLVSVDGFTSEGKEGMTLYSWQFTTISGGDDRLTVLSTSPSEGQTGVALGQQVVISFSDDVSNPDGGSVTFSPEVAGVTLAWPTADQLVITHGDFAQSLQYAVTVTGFTATDKEPMAELTLQFETTDDTGTFGPDTPYSTNPTLGMRVSSGAITIDGHNDGEWTDEMLIALDMANDDPRSLGDNWTMHETPFDYTHLWAAWDDEYLYLAWQFVDVTDILDPANAGSSHGSYPAVMDLIQWIAIDVLPGEGAALDMWGKNGGAPYWVGSDVPDYQIYIASNLWQGYISKAVDGEFAVDDGGVNYFSIDEAGITAAVGSELAATSLWGVTDVDNRDDPGALVDFMTMGHDPTRDSFYEMRIPLSALGNPDLEGSGIGIMLGHGEMSPVDTIPNDPATLDTPGTSDVNSPLEWDDQDSLTVDFARVGHF